MSPALPVPDSPARRSADLAHVIDIFIAADDEPHPENQPAAKPCEGPPCAP